MHTADFNFSLPDSLIAQQPSPLRDQSRLLVLNRASAQLVHQPAFHRILDYLIPGDVLVLNDTRVFPARLHGYKAQSGGEIEVLLLEEVSPNHWWSMLRPGKRVRAGTRIVFRSTRGDEPLSAVVMEKNDEGHCRLEFLNSQDITGLLTKFGEVPLPPYISRSPEQADIERYQTVYGREPGSVAAPTAGLHFTHALLNEAKEKGVTITEVTLHVGVGTFAPMKATEITEHVMHEERFQISAGTAETINAARAQGRRIIAVGTTTVRVLESLAAKSGGPLTATNGRTRIFIYPPYPFRMVDALVTNFHLPCSTLLMLVSAFASPGQTEGREFLLKAYAEAIQQKYRFFSYGDAMFLY